MSDHNERIDELCGDIAQAVGRRVRIDRVPAAIDRWDCSSSVLDATGAERVVACSATDLLTALRALAHEMRDRSVEAENELLPLFRRIEGESSRLCDVVSRLG